MTNTESIFATMRILKAPPIPTQKIVAPTMEQLNASNPERRAIALGALVVAPVGFLFTMTCFMMMPPAPPSAAQVARQNHILTVADGPGEAAPSNPVERQRNEWLPDPNGPGLPATTLPRVRQQTGNATPGEVNENGDGYDGIEIWPAGPGVHVRPDGKPAKAVVTEGPEHVVKAEKGKRVVAVIEPAQKQHSAVEPATGGKTSGAASEPKILKGNEHHAEPKPKPAAVSHPAPKPASTTPAAAPTPSRLEGEDDLKKPSLD
jgi:hypothetical protein